PPTPLPRSGGEGGGAAAAGDGELWVGRTVSDGRPVRIPSSALPTHVAVVGAAGSGKTWLAKVLAEEAILQGVPVLAVDPQGDLVQFLRQRDPAGLDDEERRRYERFRQVVEPRILTPGSSHGVRISLNPMRLAGPADLIGETDPQRRAEELDGMLAAAASNLVSLAKAGGEMDSQQTYILQVLKRLTAGAGAPRLGLADVAAGVLRPDEIGLDDADAFIRKAEREKLGRRLNNLLHGPSANLFTGGLPLDVEELRRPAAPGRTPLNVVYLNALHDDDQKHCFVAALAAEVYRWMATSAHTPGKPSLLFYLDEARDYIPAGASRPPAKMPLIRLFAQGRKYGVACLICTQSPRSVDYNVFGNCSTKLIGRLESAQDAERVAEWFTRQGAAPAWVKERAGAAPGTFVGRWPEMPAEMEGRTFKSRTLFSQHEGGWSPERLEREMRLGANPT
ncbi:MAG TPA: ATP-binding protein, partial [Gemmataceae bacterium]|nr:ATP-binding protein [Gemmataceae bacterium]